MGGWWAVLSRVLISRFLEFLVILLHDNQQVAFCLVRILHIEYNMFDSESIGLRVDSTPTG